MKERKEQNRFNDREESFPRDDHRTFNAVYKLFNFYFFVGETRTMKRKPRQRHWLSDKKQRTLLHRVYESALPRKINNRHALFEKGYRRCKNTIRDIR